MSAMRPVVFYLLIAALVIVVLVAWTALPDCYRPYACGY